MGLHLIRKPISHVFWPPADVSPHSYERRNKPRGLLDTPVDGFRRNLEQLCEIVYGQ